LRDRKVALFIDHLPQGLWQIRYAFRASLQDWAAKSPADFR
jgi:hypothetical protein